ncbi:uncharacterized protein LOC117654418 [Thrips palmi]|uniref:Uncharacterized protein LOC117654418 n=1 Tax=Thrips palmi TaxID=161013 RepID=A0A6P9AHL3_THRPL|nr:uncharacterized protein LOC117654418 [Thrips palmi]
MNITVRMRHPFRGIVYSRGFPLECSTAREQHHKLFDFLQEKAERGDSGGSEDNQVPLQPAREVMLSLPASECGIRVVPSKDGEGLWLQTSIVVQLDRHLQQAADQTRTASCHLPAKDSSSSVLLQPLQPLQQHRTGRQFGGDIPSVDFGAASAASWQQQHWQQRARAVMEILSTAGRAGVGSRVTDCFAHDGAGEGMERLSDGRGCPTDRLILPQLREVRVSPATLGDAVDDATTSAPYAPASASEPSAAQFKKRRKRASAASGLSTHVAAAKFAAFKFPDRSRLHLRCQLQLCRGACPQDPCLSEKANTTRQDRRVRKVRD